MEELKVSLPSTLNEIPLHRYLAYAQLPDDMDNETRLERALLLFSNVTPQHLKDMRLSDRKTLLSAMATVLNQNPKAETLFKLHNRVWGLIPNLSEMTFAEWLDLDSIKDYSKDLAKVMAILYRPVVDSAARTYSIEPYDADNKYHLLLHSMPTGIALGALVFFWTIGTQCLTATLNSIPPAPTQQPSKSNSARNGDGTPHSSISAKATLDEQLKYLENPTTKYSYGLPMNRTWRLLINHNHVLLQSN